MKSSKPESTGSGCARSRFHPGTSCWRNRVLRKLGIDSPSGVIGQVWTMVPSQDWSKNQFASPRICSTVLVSTGEPGSADAWSGWLGFRSWIHEREIARKLFVLVSVQSFQMLFFFQNHICSHTILEREQLVWARINIITVKTHCFANFFFHDATWLSFFIIPSGNFSRPSNNEHLLPGFAARSRFSTPEWLCPPSGQ